MKNQKRKETIIMSKARIRMYALIVFRELRTIDEVPKRFREEVLKEVEKMKQGVFFD